MFNLDPQHLAQPGGHKGAVAGGGLAFDAQQGLSLIHISEPTRPY